MAKRLLSHPKVVRDTFIKPHSLTLKQTVMFNTVALEVKGEDGLLNAVRIKNVKTGEESDLAACGLFYAIGRRLYFGITITTQSFAQGHIPATELVRGQVTTDEEGYVVTVPGTASTNIKGVFAAGDVQDKRYRQAITSAGSGTSSLLLISVYLVSYTSL